MNNKKINKKTKWSGSFSLLCLNEKIEAKLSTVTITEGGRSSSIPVVVINI